MRVLIVDDRVPDPHFGAGFPRAYRLLLTLIQLKHQIFFFPIIKQSIAELDLQTLEANGVLVCDSLDKIKNETIDAVLLSRPHNVHYQLETVRKYWPNAKVIYDTEALWYRRYDLQMAITGKLPNWAYRYDEIGLARQVDLCFVVNEIEKKILEDNGVKKVVKLGHALDIHNQGLVFEDRNGLLFVGGKLEEDSSNEDALWWYLDNCWNQMSGYEIDVAGTVLTDRLKNNTFQGVNLLGHVTSLTALYETKKVFVAATRFATGIPWKVHEAMANGIPCLISNLLAQQLAVTDGKEVLVASNPQEFVEKSKRLHDDKELWIKLKMNGFDLIRRDCNPDNFRDILQANLFW